MTVSLSPIGNTMIPFLTNSGIPLNGGLLYSYAAGTTTPQTTYTSNSGSIANTNPIVLQSNGVAPNPIWITDNVSYKFVLKDSSGNTLETYDNINGQGTISGNLTVGGTLTANAIVCTTNETIGGNLTVSGNISGGSFTGITGRIVQFVTATSTTASTTSTSYSSTGHTATITPSSTSSKILVMVHALLWQTNVYASNGNSLVALYRNGTNLVSGADWAMVNAITNGGTAGAYGSFCITQLDQPLTTSATTYAVYFAAQNSASVVYNSNGSAGQLILMEIL